MNLSSPIGTSVAKEERSTNFTNSTKKKVIAAHVKIPGDLLGATVH
ncbi:hypothetical protein SAMN05444280_1441 [Tangfeifania diversioriginum]|uniref:Uncharacterized protein n=1 Tax=Tangfeifania diversioriginum TaxID=1168035 RepID=A0A1M6NM43_9BACT|nr:hypothetical protein SAMN05444280_1441 [Tangfeifania diversioriginum]